METSLGLPASGGTVTAITMGYEFNLLGANTALTGKTFINFEQIDDALVEKEIPKKEESGFSMGKVLGFALAGLAVVAVVAVTVAYGASVVVSGGATLAAAPSLVPAIMGFGTFAVGAMFVTNKAVSDVQNKHNSGLDEYIAEGLVGSVRGMVCTAIYTYAAPVSILHMIGVGFLSGNIGSGIEQLMRFGNIDVNKAVMEGFGEGLTLGFFKILGGLGGIVTSKIAKMFQGTVSKTVSKVIPEIGDDVEKQITKITDDIVDDVAKPGAGNKGNKGGSKSLESLENGPYIKNGKPNGRPTLSGKEKLEFEQKVYDNCVDPDGVLRDPNTGEVINWKPGEPRQGVVDFGHNSGNSYNEMFQKYKNKGISLEELKEFQFNPDNYRLEAPSANRSHLYE
jgi:hypothetical protein